jgi:hypothetical protein
MFASERLEKIDQLCVLMIEKLPEHRLFPFLLALL